VAAQFASAVKLLVHIALWSSCPNENVISDCLNRLYAV